LDRPPLWVVAPDIEIHVKPDALHRLEAKIIDGRQYLVIEVDEHVEVNGVAVRTIGKPREFNAAEGQT
jgi:hypothetical protein